MTRTFFSLVALGQLVIVAGSGCGEASAPATDSGADSTSSDASSTDATPPTAIALTTAPLESLDYHIHVGGKGLILVDARLTPDTATATLTVQTSPLMPAQVLPSDVLQGSGLREVLLTPQASHAGQSVQITITVAGGDASASRTIQVKVQDSGYTPPTPPDKERDLFVQRLATKHPELGIDAATSWEHWVNAAGAMVVTNHLYLSKEWELNLAVHVTIPPDDWVKAYLRRRTELKPSWAATLASLSTDPTITETSPPDSVTR